MTRNLSVHGTKKIHEALLNVSVKRNPPSSQRHANLGELLVCIYFSTCNEKVSVDIYHDAKKHLLSFKTDVKLK